MQYSTLIHSNSQNNFNYNSIHPAYNVFYEQNRPRQLHSRYLEVIRQMRLTWIHTDPPPLPLPVPVCLEIFSNFEVLFEVSIYILMRNKNPQSFNVLFKVVRWNRKTFLFSFCFLLRSSDEIGRPFCFRSVSYFYYSFSFSFFTTWIGSAISPLFFNRSPSNLVGK